MNRTYMGDYDQVVADNFKYCITWGDNRLANPNFPATRTNQTLGSPKCPACASRRRRRFSPMNRREMLASGGVASLTLNRLLQPVQAVAADVKPVRIKNIELATVSRNHERSRTWH